MKTILFPTDFSAASQHAWQHALLIAEQLKAQILVLHAYLPEKIMVGETIEELMDRDTAQEKIESYLTEAKSKGITSEFVKTSLCEGNFIEILRSTVALQKPDLIIMGTNGHNTTYESGSMTAKVIAEFEIPTLAISLNAPVKKIQHLAYASDFEEENMGHVKELLELAQSLDAQLSCIHVRGADNYWSRIQASFYEQLYHLDQNVGRFDFYIISHEDVLTALNTFAKQNKVDVLVMLKHDEKDTLGSHTHHMALHAEGLLWVLHT